MTIFNLVSENQSRVNLAALLARVGLAAIFILAGINKVQYFDGNAQYMAAVGLPEQLLPLVILLELGGGLLLLLGGLTQVLSLVFALFCFTSAFLFHHNLADQMQFFMFFKNIAMTGGFLALSALGAGQWSLDARLASRFNH